ncbi:dsDNA nuclease domain-containing protein [Vagococcus fluvialis]|uniref:dsDNA nuclease domain-containing protein n=1 Tax=Vagococcus fluvialis TaxID=2738 RepID=UPI003BF18163
MERLLSIPPREQSGADSQNRFEYQVSSIVSHLIQKYKNNEEVMVYCEFHDDFSELKKGNKDKNLIFYQVKTNNVNTNWTVNRLITKDGKHSMIGAMFYNYYTFHDKCSSCFFITNITFDSNLEEWNKISKEKSEISNSMSVTYDKIKGCILTEFEGYDWFDSETFDNIFENFFRNTFFYTSNIPLETHNIHVKGEFLELYTEKMYSEYGMVRVVALIYDLVRNKSKVKLKYPITSIEELEEKKGISSKIFDSLELRKDSDTIISKSDKISLVINEYIPDNIQLNKILIRIWEKHHKRMLDINDYLYRDQVSKFEDVIEDFVFSEISNISEKRYDIVYKRIKDLITEFIKDNSISWENSNLVLEVVYFEYFIK